MAVPFEQLLTTSGWLIISPVYPRHIRPLASNSLHGTSPSTPSQLLIVQTNIECNGGRRLMAKALRLPTSAVPGRTSFDPGIRECMADDELHYTISGGSGRLAPPPSRPAHVMERAPRSFRADSLHIHGSSPLDWRFGTLQRRQFVGHSSSLWAIRETNQRGLEFQAVQRHQRIT